MAQFNALPVRDGSSVEEVWLSTDVNLTFDIIIHPFPLLPLTGVAWPYRQLNNRTGQDRGEDTQGEAAMGREARGPGSMEGGLIDSKGGGRCLSRGGGNKKGGCTATKGINYKIRTVIFSTLM